MKKLSLLLMAAILTLCTACSGGAPSVTEDKYVRLVKGGTLNEYPQASVGEAFGGFLSNAKWKSLVADDGNRYVNVTGGATYLEKDVEIVVQFLVDYDEEMFEIYAFEINGVPQSNYILWGLLEATYEGVEETTSSAQSGNRATNTQSGEVTYKGKPLSPFLGMQWDSNMEPPIDDDGIYFWSNGERISEIYVHNLSALEVDGITLDRNFEGIIGILGEPSSAGWTMVEGSDAYAVEYETVDYTISFMTFTGGPEAKPTTVQIYRY